MVIYIMGGGRGGGNDSRDSAPQVPISSGRKASEKKKSDHARHPRGAFSGRGTGVGIYMYMTSFFFSFLRSVYR